MSGEKSDPRTQQLQSFLELRTRLVLKVKLYPIHNPTSLLVLALSAPTHRARGSLLFAAALTRQHLGYHHKAVCDQHSTRTIKSDQFVFPLKQRVT